MSASQAPDDTRRSPNWLGRSRYSAFAGHFAISAAIMGGFCALTFFVWYPHPYFAASSAWSALRVLIVVYLVIGPLLTLIVFKPGKWGMKFDLWVIGTLQLAALVIGGSAIYRERPARPSVPSIEQLLVEGGDGRIADLKKKAAFQDIKGFLFPFMVTRHGPTFR